MACFDNLIGLKGSCGESALPSDGLYLNTLGISREFIEDIINEDYADVDSFVLDKISLAQDQIKSDEKGQLREPHHPLRSGGRRLTQPHPT